MKVDEKAEFGIYVRYRSNRSHLSSFITYSSIYIAIGRIVVVGGLY